MMTNNVVAKIDILVSEKLLLRCKQYQEKFPKISSCKRNGVFIFKRFLKSGKSTDSCVIKKLRAVFGIISEIEWIII